MTSISLTRGERFKDARTVHNKNGTQTIQVVETQTGVSASMLSNLENDEKKRGVSYKIVAKLAKYYGVTSDYLLGLTDTPSYNLDLRAASEYSGLSASVLERFSLLKNGEGRSRIEALNLLMSAGLFGRLLDSAADFMFAARDCDKFVRDDFGETERKSAREDFPYSSTPETDLEDQIELAELVYDAFTHSRNQLRSDFDYLLDYVFDFYRQSFLLEEYIDSLKQSSETYGRGSGRSAYRIWRSDNGETRSE